MILFCITRFSDQKWQYLDEIGTYEYRDDRDGIFSLQYSHDGSILAVGFGDGAIEVFCMDLSYVLLIWQMLYIYLYNYSISIFVF